MKLKKIVELIPGLNPSRIKNSEEINFYDKESFENDSLYLEKFSEIEKVDDKLNIGDVVIYTPTNKAVIVGKHGCGKELTLNFVKVNFIQDKLDKRYFVYMYNESNIVKSQFHREIQGNTIMKITLSSIYEIRIPILDKLVQEKIGQAYIESIRLSSNLSKYGQLIEKSTLQILENRVREKNERRLYKTK